MTENTFLFVSGVVSSLFTVVFVKTKDWTFAVLSAVVTIALFTFLKLK